MKRSTAIKRSPFMTKSRSDPVPRKPVKCRAPGCENRFFRRSMTHKACGPDCAEALVAAERVREAERAARAEATEYRKRLADHKPLSHWLKATERVVNHFIVTRDRHRPCISCGTFDTVQWEAGHFKSVGAHREMRYLAHNIHKQCHRCNVQFSGNIHGYRAGLLNRYGQAMLDALDAAHPMIDHTRESLAEIRREFAAKTRQLKSAANDDHAEAAA